MATEGSSDFMGPVRPSPSSNAPPPSFSQASSLFSRAVSWVKDVISPTPVTASAILTPPVRFEKTTMATPRFSAAVDQAQAAASTAIAAATKKRIEGDVDVFNYIKPVIGGQTINMGDYAKGVYKDKWQANLRATQVQQEARDLPVLTRERLMEPVKIVDAPTGQFYFESQPASGFFFFGKATKAEARPTIEAPLTEANQLEFARRFAPDKSVKPGTENFVSAIPAYVASSPREFGGQVILHEGSHALNYGTVGEQEQFERTMRTVANIPDISKEKLKTAPYPISHPREFGPAGGAIQRYYASTHGGERIETAQQYDNWVRQFDNLSDREIWNLDVPLELKRALQYRLNPDYRENIERGYRYILPALFMQTRQVRPPVV